MAIINAYFDESVAYKGRRIFCVAGYLVKASQTKAFHRQWKRALKAYDLPYFRMSACAHGNEPFQHLSRNKRIDVEKRMIESIKQRTVLGLAITVDIDELEQARLSHPMLGSPYTFCLHWIMGGVYEWLEQSGYRGSVAYFFEAGHPSQSEANRIMGDVFRIPELRELSRYAQHGFVDKIRVPAVQAADLLAWQWYTDIRHKDEFRPRRKDLESLLDHPHKTFHVRPDILRKLSATLGSIQDPTEFLMRFHMGEPEFSRIKALKE